VETALTETRLTLFSEDHGLEWGTPVLYMRANDGRVFNVQQQDDAARKQARISELYHAATAAMTAQKWDEARTNWQAILAVDPGHVHATAGLEQISKQQELAKLYAEGRAHMEAGRWHEALASLSMAQAIDAGYMDVSALVGDARQRVQATQATQVTQGAQVAQVAPNTPMNGMPVVDTRGTAPYGGQQQGSTNLRPQVDGGGGTGGGRATYEGAVPAPLPVPAPKRSMAWVIPVVLVVVLAVLGAAAFAIISAQQSGERAANATATAEAQAANSKATGTAVARRRVATARANANATGTSQALDSIYYANATSTAYAILLEGANATATVQAYATQTATNIDPTARSATIQNVRLVHNIYNSDKVKGMEIHIEFTTDNLKDVVLPVNVYFSWPDGTKIVSMDGTYEAPDNQVAVRKDAQPGYALTKYDDFVIFMPYAELEMDFKAGTFDIQCQVVIYDDSNKELARSAYIPFSYASPGP
jgi:hypothetical protein